MIAAASLIGAAALAFLLWRWLFGPLDEPPGWDVPPADWDVEAATRAREGDEQP